MLTLALCNTVTFFYPMGNTPAVALTQDIPTLFDNYLANNIEQLDLWI